MSERKHHRADLFALLLLAAVLALLFADLLAGTATLFFEDFSRWFWPYRSFLISELRSGRLPLWNPYAGLGAPFAANPETGSLYPLNLLLLAGDPLAALCRFGVVHLFLAGLFVYLLARDAGARPAAALVGGSSAALSGVALSYLEAFDFFAALVWLPAALLALRRALCCPVLAAALSWAMASGAAVALSLYAGDPMVALDCALVLTLYALAHVMLRGDAGDRRLASDPPGSFPAGDGQRGAADRPTTSMRPAAAAALRALGLLAMAGLGAVVLSGPQLLSALEFLPLSERASGVAPTGAAGPEQWSLPPLGLVTLLLPHGQGLLLPDNTLWLAEGLRQWFHSLYLGLAVVLLVPLALPLARRQPLVAAALAASAILLLLALGRHLGAYQLASSVFPPLRLFRYPAKLFGPCALLLPLVASLGLEHALAERRRRGRGLLAAAIAALLTGGLGVALATAGQGLAPLVASQALLPELVAGAVAQLRSDGVHLAAIAMALAVALWLARRLAHGTAAWAVALVAVLDLAWAALPLLWTTDPALLRAPLATTSLLASPAAQQADQLPAPPRFLRLPHTPELRLHRSQEGYLRQVAWMRATQVPDLPLAERLDSLLSYTPGRVAEAQQLLEAALMSHPAETMAVLATPVLLLGGQGARFPSVAGDLSAQRLSPLAVLPDLGVEVLRADQALPRAYLAASGRLIEATGGPAAFTGWLAGGGTAAELRRQAVVDSSELLVAGRRVFDHQQVARLTGRLLASPPAAGPPPAPTAGSARILVYESSRVEVEVETASPAGGLLVLADQFLPGWQALVDDRETPLLRANFMGRGVIVPAGRHRVLFAYRPAGLTRGCLLATGGLLLWVALLAAARWPAARWPCRRATGPCNIHRAQMCE